MYICLLCASGHYSCTSSLDYQHAPYCGNTRGLPVGGYFVPYQQGIQHLQRRRTMRVAVKTISNNSSAGKGVSRAIWTPRKTSPGPNLLDCQCLYVRNCVGADCCRKNYTKLRTLL